MRPDTCPAPAVPAPAPVGAGVPGGPRAVGSVVAGRYRLTRALGQGGMGELFVAVDERAGRTVVLKFVRADRGDDDNRAALVAEGRLLRRAQGPHVVAVHDLGGDGDDGFVALEHLRGRDLEATLAERTCLSWRDGVRLAAQIARALVGVHDAGVVHGDLKPANVFLCDAAGAQPFVKLIDFGIASAVDDDAAAAADGAIRGTVGYIAPERLVGAAASPASDLYALGVLAWAVCAGREPFVARTTTELLFSHAFQPAPRLGSAATVPAALDDLVHALLDKDPAARPTAAAAAVALERLARTIVGVDGRNKPAPRRPAVRVERAFAPLSVVDPWSFAVERTARRGQGAATAVVPLARCA